MRKRILTQDVYGVHSTEGAWLDLERLARVEITSENPAHPVEAALLPGREGGWRAARPGGQRLRLLFDEPQVIRRVYLVFDEHERARTQELTLLWSPPGGSAL